MTQKLKAVSLFFPCHNEAANVMSVIADAARLAPQIGDDHEIIIVDDGSRDETATLVRQAAAADSHVRLVQHSVNKGYGEALKSGFRAARYPWVFYSDGDRQFDLNELPRLLPKTENADIVSGFRQKRVDPWHRKLNAGIFELALRVFYGLRIPDVDCAFKIYRREIFDRIPMKASGAMIDAEILARAKQLGYRIDTMGVSHYPRMAGTQSGAKLGVIGRAMKEFWMIWWDVFIKRTPS